jgi:hypothetical protein
MLDTTYYYEQVLMLIGNSLQVCQGVLALKDNCLTADTKTTYIKSITGGINSSPEGFTVRLQISETK